VGTGVSVVTHDRGGVAKRTYIQIAVRADCKELGFLKSATFGRHKVVNERSSRTVVSYHAICMRAANKKLDRSCLIDIAHGVGIQIAKNHPPDLTGLRDVNHKGLLVKPALAVVDDYCNRLLACL